MELSVEVRVLEALEVGARGGCERAEGRGRELLVLGRRTGGMHVREAVATAATKAVCAAGRHRSALQLLIRSEHARREELASADHSGRCRLWHLPERAAVVHQRRAAALAAEEQAEARARAEASDDHIGALADAARRWDNFVEAQRHAVGCLLASEGAGRKRCDAAQRTALIREVGMSAALRPFFAGQAARRAGERAAVLAAATQLPAAAAEEEAERAALLRWHDEVLQRWAAAAADLADAHEEGAARVRRAEDTERDGIVTLPQFVELHRHRVMAALVGKAEAADGEAGGRSSMQLREGQEWAALLKRAAEHRGWAAGRQSARDKVGEAEAKGRRSAAVDEAKAFAAIVAAWDSLAAARRAVLASEEGQRLRVQSEEDGLFCKMVAAAEAALRGRQQLVEAESAPRKKLDAAQSEVWSKMLKWEIRTRRATWEAAWQGASMRAAVRCEACATSFSPFVWRKRCRGCGGVFCSKCTAAVPLPEFGYEKPELACAACIALAEQEQERRRRRMEQLQREREEAAALALLEQQPVFAEARRLQREAAAATAVEAAAAVHAGGWWTAAASEDAPQSCSSDAAERAIAAALADVRKARAQPQPASTPPPAPPEPLHVNPRVVGWQHSVALRLQAGP